MPVHTVHEPTAHLADPQLRLTEFSLRSLKPRGEQYAVYDDALPNFGVRVGEKGKLSFFVMYSLHGRRRRDTLGRFPILCLAEARTIARKRLAHITLHRQVPSAGCSTTFGEAVESFLKTHCAVLNKASTATETQRLLKRHWLPPFSRRLLIDIHAKEIVRIIDDLRAKQSEARHAFAALRTVFNWARQRQMIDRSPCEGLQLGLRGGARDRVLSEPEIVAVWRAAETLGYPYGRIVQLLILTGQRRNEIASLRRSYIAAANQLITLPAAIVKNNRQHTFAYGPMVAEILAGLPDIGDMLFPARGHDDVPFSGWSKAKAALDQLAGVDFTLHDLRRTWATHAANLDVNPWIIEAHLNHVSGVISGVSAIYNRHKYLAQTREAVDRFESYLRHLVAQPDRLLLA